MTEKQQPGACLQCHAANLALYRFVGKGDVQKGFEQVSGMPYAEARNLKDDKGQALVQHPVACVDCHAGTSYIGGDRTGSGGANNPTTGPTPPSDIAPFLARWSVCSTVVFPSRSRLTQTAPSILTSASTRAS